jgi:hypothetical protein
MMNSLVFETKNKSSLTLSGTSNSIIVNAFSSALQKYFFGHFLNRSLGASSATALAYHSPNINFDEQDFVILEYSVNESVFLYAKQIQIESTYNQLANIVDIAAHQNCMSVFVNFPTVTRFGWRTPILELIEQKFCKHGAFLFDIDNIIGRAAKLSGLKPTSFFMDKLHLRRETGFVVGQILAEQLNRIKNLETNSAHMSRTPETYQRAQFVEANNSRAKITRSSKLISTSLLTLNEGESFTVHPEHYPYVIRACVYNEARSKGKLMHGNKELIAAPRYATLYGKANDFTLVCLPAGLDQTQMMEPSTITYARPSNDIEAIFEVAGVVVEYPYQFHDLHVTKLAEPMSVMLHENISASDLERVIATAHQ